MDKKTLYRINKIKKDFEETATLNTVQKELIENYVVHQMLHEELVKAYSKNAVEFGGKLKIMIQLQKEQALINSMQSTMHKVLPYKDKIELKKEKKEIEEKKSDDWIQKKILDFKERNQKNGK